MAEGFIVDYAHGAVFPAHWHPGAPQKSFLYKTKVDRDELYATTAYRCSECGFLELYAAEKGKV